MRLYNKLLYCTVSLGTPLYGIVSLSLSVSEEVTDRRGNYPHHSFHKPLIYSPKEIGKCHKEKNKDVDSYGCQNPSTHKKTSQFQSFF